MLCTQDWFEDYIEGIGKNNEGKKFKEAFGNYQNGMELLGHTAIDALLYEQKIKEIVSSLHDMERYWSIIKLTPDVSSKMNEEEKLKISTAIQNALNKIQTENIVE